MERVANNFQITLLIINTLFPFTMAFIGIFYVAFNVPSHLFDQRELEELKDSYSLKPLLDIIDNKNTTNESLLPLLGKYKGFKGGHRYKKCSKLFSDTCKAYKDRDYVYCSNDDVKPLDKSICVDYPTIPETYYINYKDKYLYAKKSDDTYESLLKVAISKNEKCPEGHKKCGILVKNLITCYKNEDDCPINDFIINNNSEYIKDNILYKTIKINNNEYFHYTNEQINNQIIFDLLLSLEHPLSKVELPEENYDTIYKCHEYEIESYYRGNIENSKVYKQIYNTDMTYKELIEKNDLYYKIIAERRYRKQHFPSKIFIYKKNPIPITTLTYNEINDLEDDYFASFVLNFFSCGILFLSAGLNCALYLCGTDGRKCLYITLTLTHFLICLFFFLKIKVLTNSEDFQYDNIGFNEKDHHRYELLCFHATYTALVIFQNLCAIYIWIRSCQKGN